MNLEVVTYGSDENPITQVSEVNRSGDLEFQLRLCREAFNQEVYEMADDLDNDPAADSYEDWSFENAEELSAEFSRRVK